VTCFVVLICDVRYHGRVVDTVKIRRPVFPRDPNGPDGRVEHDERGNAVWKKTRATDTTELPDTSSLSITMEDTASKSWDVDATQESDVLALRSAEKAKRK
jgi:hypothetical protein